MINSKSVELCPALIEKYHSLHNAPDYDMAGQSNEMRQAYATYRQGIDLLEAQAGVILNCGQNGKPMGAFDLGMVHSAAAKAVDVFGQARDWVKRAVIVSSDSPLADAVARMQTAVTQISLSFQRILVGRDEPCDPFVNEYNTLLNAPTYDVSAQPANVQNAYGLYRQAIKLAVSKAAPVAEVCGKGGGILGKLDETTAEPVLKQAESMLNEALSALGR